MHLLQQTKGIVPNT